MLLKCWTSPVEMYGLYGEYSQTLKTPRNRLTEWKLALPHSLVLWQMVVIQKQPINVCIMTQMQDNL